MSAHTWNSLIELVFDFCEAFIFLYCFLFITNNRTFLKNNRAQVVFFISMFTIYDVFLTLFMPAEVKSIAILILSIFILSFLTRTNIFISIVSLFIITIFYGITESICGLTLTIITQKSNEIILSTPSLKFTAYLFSKAIQAGILAFIYPKGFKNIFKHSLFSKENYTLSLLVLQIGIIVIFFTGAINTTNMTLYTISIFVFFLMLIIIGAIDYRERERALNTKKQFIAQTEYIRNLETVVDIIRKEKHEFANHLNTLIAMCMLKKPDTLDSIEAYAKKLVNNTGSSYKFYDTGNTYIDGLLAVKSNFAYEHHIQFDIDFEEPLSGLKIDDIDLTSILGNIIDNAFDAMLADEGSKERILSLYTYQEGDIYYIAIANNGGKIAENDLERIFEQKFSTKAATKDKTVRGYGLFITKQLVLKNGGKISVRSTPEETEFLVEFKVSSENGDLSINKKAASA